MEIEIPLSTEEWTALKDRADQKRDTIWGTAAWLLGKAPPEHAGTMRGEPARHVACILKGQAAKRIRAGALTLDEPPEDYARRKLVAHLFGHD